MDGVAAKSAFATFAQLAPVCQCFECLSGLPVEVCLTASQCRQQDIIELEANIVRGNLFRSQPRRGMVDAVAVLDERGSASFQFTLEVQDVLSYGSGQVDLQIVKGGVASRHIDKVKRTYEAHRLIELAAIAVAGLGLFAAGGHQIWDVALRGSSADYLVDEENYLQEVSGRSRRSDFQIAWDSRWNRLGFVGVFWQTETFDHYSRDEAEKMRIVHYIDNNPVKAGLEAYPTMD